MPTDQQLPIQAGGNVDIDEVTLVTHGSILQDGYIDQQGGINRRPGTELFVAAQDFKPVYGLFWAVRSEACLAAVEVYDSGVAKARIMQILDPAGATFNIGTPFGFTPGFLLPRLPITWVEHDKFSCFAANGDRIVVIEPRHVTTGDIIDSGGAYLLPDGDAPAVVTHITALDKYLIANEAGTDRFHWSSVSNPQTWAGDFASAENQPDGLLALHSAGPFLYLFGSNSIEFWRDDGVTPFVPDVQNAIATGTIAPGSVTNCDGVFYFLDQSKQAVRLVGTTVQPLNPVLNRHIQSFGIVNDALGSYLRIAGRLFWLLTFPSAGKTIVYDIISGLWSQWGSWDIVAAGYDAFNMLSYAQCDPWGFTVAAGQEGAIYKISDDAYDDNGNLLRTMVRTPQIDHGTSGRRKFSKRLIFRLKRSNLLRAEPQTEPLRLTVRWRDNGSTSWQPERTIELQNAGDTMYRGEMRRLGQYYSRQYEIVLQSKIPAVLSSVSEDFEYGRP
jgi:hypothetical protein